eukprot:8148030-Ditylum_brightwellii.AAC.1
MVDIVQMSVRTATTPNVNSTAHMETLIKKYVAVEIACILPDIISAMLKELNVTKPITNNINTSNSVTIITITREGNINNVQKEDTNMKEVSNNNTHSTATSSQDSSSVHNDAPDPDYESVNVEDENQMTQAKNKSSTLNKVALIQ